MEVRAILEGKATIEDLMILAAFGYEFVIENGAITKVVK